MGLYPVCAVDLLFTTYLTVLEVPMYCCSKLCSTPLKAMGCGARRRETRTHVMSDV